LDIDKRSDNFDAVLVRNIWPSHEYELEKTSIIRWLINKGHIPASSAEDGYLHHPHYLEKEYLLDLFRQGYPVIPSVDTFQDINKLGNPGLYFIKPKNMCDGAGSMKIARKDLLRKKLRDYLIQPYIKFDCEICFYFIDNEFIYAFSTPNRLRDEKYQVYQPTQKDMEFANKFVQWNKMSYGLQRVDAVRVSKTKELLLTELEDFGPYLYLLELPENVCVKVVSALANSIIKRL
jgi:hypothetical protein